MNIVQRAKKVVTARLLKRKKKLYRPDYCDATFVRTVDVSVMTSLLEKTHVHAGVNPGGSLAAICTHFRTRSTPIFFHRPAQLQRMVTEAQEKHPQWVSRCLDRVREEHAVGLAVYAQPGAALVAPFPWAGQTLFQSQDIQYRKRPHRFAFLPRMALASLYDPDISGWMQEIVSDWIKFAEDTDGDLAFSSNLAVIQRLMATSWAWHYCCSFPESEASSVLEVLLLKIISSDIRFLWPRLGNSYGNNHLLADYFAGWFIGKMFPEFVPRDGVVRQYEDLWLNELSRQTSSDGWSFEHCTHYHEFACDMALIYLLLSRANHWPITKNVKSRIKAMLRVQSELGGESGIAIQLGDATEENFLPLGVHEGHGPALYREAYRSLFDPSLAPVDSEQPAVEAAWWLLGELAQFPACSSGSQGSSLHEFGDAGLLFLADKDKGLDVLFRTGPPTGTRISAGHVHSDWLGIYVRCNGIPFVVDSGTYSYRASPEKWPPGEPCWRHYFRGPEAHNVAVVRGVDPLGEVPGGDFRPAEMVARVNTQVRAEGPLVSWVEASYCDVPTLQGYVRGVVQLSARYTVVYDIHPSSVTLDWASFQYAPDCAVRLVNRTVEATHKNGEKLSVYTGDGIADVQLLHGSREPLAGWVSSRYGHLAKASQIRYVFDSTRQFTAFLLETGRQQWGGLSSCESNGLYTLEATSEEFTDRLLISSQGSDGINVASVGTDASLCWLRMRGEELLELRAVRAKRLSLPGYMEIRFAQKEDWVDISWAAGDVTVQTSSGQPASIEYKE